METTDDDVLWHSSKEPVAPSRIVLLETFCMFTHEINERRFG